MIRGAIPRAVMVPVHVAVAPVPVNVHVTPGVAALLPKDIVPVGVVGVVLVSVTVTGQATFKLYNTIGDGVHTLVVVVGWRLRSWTVAVPELPAWVVVSPA